MNPGKYLVRVSPRWSSLLSLFSLFFSVQTRLHISQGRKKKSEWKKTKRKANVMCIKMSTCVLLYTFIKTNMIYQFTVAHFKLKYYSCGKKHICGPCQVKGTEIEKGRIVLILLLWWTGDKSLFPPHITCSFGLVEELCWRTQAYNVSSFDRYTIWEHTVPMMASLALTRDRWKLEDHTSALKLFSLAVKHITSLISLNENSHMNSYLPPYMQVSTET